MRPPVDRLAIVTTLALLVCTPVSAQDTQAAGIRYTTVTKTEMGGMFSMMTPPGMGDDREEVTYAQGLRIRQDAEDASVIMDLGTGAMLQIDHESKTFVRGDLGSLEDMVNTAAGDAGGGQPTAMPTDMEMTVSVDPTDETEEIDGYEARRVFVTVEATPTGAAAEQEVVFKSVVLMDMWVSSDERLEEAMRTLFEESRGMFSRSSNVGAGMTAGPMFGQDAGLQSGMARMVEELQKLDGMPLRTTLRYVAVPMDQDFDRDGALEQTSESFMAQVIQEEAEESARRSVRGRLGRLGRAISRNRPEPEPEEPPVPGMVNGQTTFMTITTEVKDIEVGALEDFLFEVPEGYEERGSPGGPGAGQ